jgi:MFS family permease
MKLLRSSVLQLRDFQLLLLSRWLQTFALNFQDVIIGWQIYQHRKEAYLLGLIGLTEALPAITCSFFAGHFVDTSRPAKILNISILVNAINAFIIFLSVGPWLTDSADVKIAVLFIGIFISGITRSFISPSQFSLLPKIVSRELLPAAAAINSSSYTMAQILGPAIGGLAYGFLGPSPAFFIPFVVLFAAFFSQLFFSPAIKNFMPSNVREPMFQSIRSGLRFLSGHKVLLSTMALDMFSVLFGGAVAVLPIFADQVFHVGSSGLGILRSAPAVGSVLISIVFAIWPMKVISGKRLLFVITGFGICMLLFGMTTQFYLALLLLVLSGVFDGVNMIIRGTLTQLLTPENMRGRVSSLGTVFITSSNEIGAFESGIAAQFMGLIPSVIFGGIMTLVVVSIVMWTVPELKQTEIKTS